jgi:diguanylate cyclase (GGDEF)-like protein/PAS domain S-box-containing protein
MRSVLAVPLLVEDRPVGAMAVWAAAPDRFTNADAQVLTMVATAFAPSIAAARASAEAGAKARIFQAIREVAEAATSGLDPRQLAARLVSHARSLLGVDGSAIYWSGSDADRLRSLAHDDPVMDSAAIQLTSGEGVIGAAYKEHRVIVIEDYQAWSGAQNVVASKGVASAAAVPLVVQNRAVGSLGVWSYTKRSFRPDELQVLTYFAAQAAPAIESANLLKEREARARTFQTLYDLATGAHDPDEMARRAVDCARDLAGAIGSMLFRWDSKTNELLLVAHNDPEWDVAQKAGPGALWMALEQKESIIIDDYQGWEHAKPEGIRLGLKNLAVLPLLVREQVVGVIAVRGQRTLSGERLQSLSLLAALVAPALEAADRSAEREVQANTFRALHEIAVAASGVIEPVWLATLAVDHARDLLDVDSAALVWKDPDGLRFLADNAAVQSPPVVGYEQGAVHISRREPVVITDYATWKGAYQPAVAAGIQSVAAVPLLVGERAVGGLVARSTDSAHFDADRVRLITLLAAQVGPGLQAARLVQEREAQRGALVALHELAVAASGILEPAALAQHAIQRASELFDTDRVALYWWNEEASHLSVLAETKAMSGRLMRGDGIAGQAFHKIKPVCVEDYRKWKHATPWALKAGVKSALGVPLLVHDRAVGAIAVGSRKLHRIEPEHVQLLSLLAAQVAPALHAARLHADLVKSEERFRSLYGTIACGVLVQSPTGHVIDANPAAAAVIGLSIEEMRGRRSDELWEATTESGETLPFEERPVMLSALQGRPVRDFMMRIRRRDGEVRWLQIDSIPVPDPEGGPGQIVSSFLDVTERKNAEAALRESESRFRAVFDRAAVGIARIGLDGKLMDANPAIASMLAYQPDQILGRSLKDLTHPDDYQPEAFARLVAGDLEVSEAEARYLRKDGDPIWCRSITTLVRSSEGQPLFVIGMLENITERKAQDAALEHQALHDALTDLPNRTLLQDRLHQAIRLSRRDGTEMALLVMDLDRFKEINDTFGHHFGDVILRMVAGRLVGEVRSSDTVARLGGDEFAAVLPNVDGRAGAELAARKLLRALEAPFVLEGEGLEIGGSVGIALYPEDGKDAETLMRRADVAMYVAKRAVSGFAFYAADKDVYSPSRLALMSDLRPAIDEAQFVLHYQPKIDLRTHRIAGAEALVRWQHPRHGLLMPDQFIPLAEQTGLIRQLGLWVVESALAQSRAWRGAGLDLTVAVNLSMRNLHDPHLPEAISDLLEQFQVPPGMLQIEITESALMADPEHAMRILTSLERMGVKLAIDDFGTGYSSLAYLRRLPAEEIKIDRSFVIDMPLADSDAVIVRSTIDLGHNLGMRVVAEGVETREAFDLLASVECDLGQGYYMARPMTAEQLTPKLGRTFPGRPEKDAG